DPFLPTIPKNSPLWTSKEICRRARSSRYSMRVNGWVARSLSESIRRSGIRKVLSRPRASMTTGPSPARTEEELAGPVSSPVVVVLRMAIRPEPLSQANSELTPHKLRRAADDRVRLIDHQARGLRPLRRARHPAGGRAGFGGLRPSCDRVDLLQLQRAAREGRGTRGARGPGAGRPGR